MRVVYSFLIMVAIASQGCSLLITSSGEKLGSLETKENVHRVFGEPIDNGVSEKEKQSFETFYTHRKIAEPSFMNEGMVFADLYTLGLAEIFFCPVCIYSAAQKSILGQTLKFVYNSDGTVASVFLDGAVVPYVRH